MAILTSTEAMDALNYTEIAQMPDKVVNIFLPAVDNYLTYATGKDWGTLTTTYTTIDALAKLIASVLLCRWFEDPSQLGKVNDDGLMAMITQLKSKYLQELSAP